NFNDGLHKYPYGNSFDPYACNGAEAEAGAATNVGAFAKCNGGVNGLKDMMGNYWEWDNECEGYDPDAGQDPAKQSCYLHGGSWPNNLNNFSCGVAGIQRAQAGCEWGLRCCASQ